MGCDYYILKKLHIYYAINEYLEIEINRKYAYFHDDSLSDSDDDNEYSEEDFREYVRYILTPKMKPILLYDGRQWITQIFENKYKSLLDNILKQNNILWEQIINILKVEERKLR